MKKNITLICAVLIFSLSSIAGPDSDSEYADFMMAFLSTPLIVEAIASRLSTNYEGVGAALFVPIGAAGGALLLYSKGKLKNPVASLVVDLVVMSVALAAIVDCYASSFSILMSNCLPSNRNLAHPPC
jgi:hypothetical protein